MWGNAADGDDDGDDDVVYDDVTNMCCVSYRLTRQQVKGIDDAVMRQELDDAEMKVEQCKVNNWRSLIFLETNEVTVVVAAAAATTDDSSPQMVLRPSLVGLVPLLGLY